jgi:putative copper resistance protein D
MCRPTAVADVRLGPVLWTGLAVGTALVAAVLAGALGGSSLGALLGTAVTRTAGDVAGVACVGLALVGLLLPGGRADAGEAHRVRALADRALVAAGGAWLVLTVAGIAYRAADGFDRPVGSLTWRDVVVWTSQLAAGRGALLTTACAAAVFGCAVARVRNPDAVAVRIVLVAALLGMLTPAVTGHASSDAGHEVAVTTVAVHVAAAALTQTAP